MLELVLLRHSETQMNRDLLLQGHTDIVPLDPTVPDSLVDALLGLGEIVSVYTSDLKRCRIPAYDLYRKVVSRTKHQWPIPYVETPLLRERCFGVLEGKCYADFDVDNAGSLGQKLYALGIIEAGESKEETGERAAFIARELRDPAGYFGYMDHAIIPVVTHGCFLNYLITALIQCNGFDCNSLAEYRAAGNLRGFRVQLDNSKRELPVCDIISFPGETK